MKKYDLYLFDFDLTIADSQKSIVASFQTVLKDMGYTDIKDEVIIKTIGFPLKKEFEMITKREDPEFLDACYDGFQKVADKIMCPYTEMFPETVPTLDKLKADGAKVAIVSTKRKEHIVKILEYRGLGDYFDIIIGPSDVENVKPAPDGIFKAAKALSVPLKDCIYIGDTTIDAYAGLNAKVDFAAVTTGHTPAKDFEEIAHVAIMKNLTELLNY